MTPRISVIIPTHNRAQLLGRALDSVVAQTRPADEIIVIDDGSTDTTLDLLQSYPQVQYHYQAQAGVSAARNRGVEIATGEWIALLDSDDEWLPQKLARQLETLPSASRIAHCDEIWMRRGRRVNPMKKHAKAGGWIYQNCLPLCVISPSAVLIHRSVFDTVGVFDEALLACEDYDLWLRICARLPVHFLDQALVVKYGGHPDQLSSQFPGMDRFRIRALEKILASNILPDTDYQATLTILIEKIDIYSNGASKRKRQQEASHYRDMRERYSQQLAACEQRA